MPWPLSQDYNEAVQNPATSFTDPELRQAEATTNALGLPTPCSGNFADVYQLRAGQRAWAVKCFTREIPGLRERYIEISKYLQQVRLPFMVEFKYLDQGVRVRNQWYPILKMDWVQGFTLNQFVKDHLDKPQVLDKLCQLWVQLSSRLREANLAHCDLQHGNVLLVQASRAGAVSIKLVDYDGMCVPALTMLKSIELGHPSYQHPQRIREGLYGLEVDRFSHLVIYTALRAVMASGRRLWDKYDNGDNLLFRQQDFEAPGQSAVLQELSRIGNTEVQTLASIVSRAAQGPMEQTPLLETLVKAPGLAPGVGQRKTGLPIGQQNQQPQVEQFADLHDPRSPTGRRRQRKTGKAMIWVALLAAVGVCAIGGSAVWFATSEKQTRSSRSGTPTELAEVPPPSASATHPQTKAERKTTQKTSTAPEPPIKSGLQLWLDASDSSTLWQDSVRTIPVTADNNLVGTWDDKSGNGNNVNQPVSTKRPRYRTAVLNSRPVLRFDGVDDWLTAGDKIDALTSDIYIFAVAKYRTAAPGSLVAKSTYSGKPNRYWLNRSNWEDGSSRLDTGFQCDAGHEINASLPDSSTSWRIVTAALSRSTGTIRLLTNGSVLASANYPDGHNTDSTSRLLIGAYNNPDDSGEQSGYFFDGDLAEILIYRATLSQSDRERVEVYLASKFGISLTEPAVTDSKTPQAHQPKYLVDMTELEFKIGVPGWNLGKGLMGNGPTPIVVSGKKYPRGLSTTPPGGGFCGVKYRIDKDMNAFSASVALDDSSGPRNPVTFEVLGDGRSLWTSKRIQTKGEKQECSVAIKGVSILELRTICNGPDSYGCHAVWLDPRLSRSAADLEMLPQLEQRLKSQLPSERLEAIRGLDALGTGAAPATLGLRSVLMNDENENARAAAAACLGKIGPDAREAVATLYLSTITDPFWKVRAEALLALGKMGAEAKLVGPLLDQRTMREKDEAVLNANKEALKQLGRSKLDPGAEPPRYLSDITETGSADGHGSLGKNGDLGYLPPSHDRRILFAGMHMQKGLSMHGIPGKHAFASYDLGGKYTMLHTAAAISDSVRNPNNKPDNKGMSESPMIFTVVGDGKELWKSGPIQQSGEAAACSIRIAGINRLELRVFCVKHGFTYAIWLDPYVK
jgi:hypothetical protein